MKRLWLLLVLGLMLAAPARANNYSVFCNREPRLTAEQKNRLLLFADTVKSVLETSGHNMAVIARSGINLDRFGLRYSHAALALRNNPNTPWSVRQLYFSCEEEIPRIYDQGLAGFLIDQDNSRRPFISLVFLSEPEERAVEKAALDKPLTLGLLGKAYSANAYAFSTLFQNCNQWVVELIAHALGQLPDNGDLRADAQQWLAAEHYHPTDVTVRNPFIVMGGLMVPLLHSADHPQQNIAAGHFLVSMPDSVDTFLHTHVPGTTRVELCMNANQIVAHRGWEAIPAGCQATPGDRVWPVS